MIMRRGGQDEERLYLENLHFYHNDIVVDVSKTDFNLSGNDMEDLVVRHKARYYPVGLFLRPGMSLLDFPCGSGYAAAIFRNFNIYYEGRDNDSPTIEYAKRMYGMYGDEQAIFKVADLCDPLLNEKQYDVIACIEGLEHIDIGCQGPLISFFDLSLKKGGTLIISSPEAEESGPNPKNSFHKWELTEDDFWELLYSCFDIVELITHKTRFHTGEWGTTLYGICHKE